MRMIHVAAVFTLALASCGAPSGNEADRDAGNEEYVVEDITPVDGARTAGTTSQSGWPAQVRRTEQGGYVMGNPQAKIRLVEYGSRTCPACARFSAQGMDGIVKRYVAKGNVSYEFRDFIIHGGPDIASSLVGRCAPPERFFPILEATYAAQEASLGRLARTTAPEQEALKAMPVQKALAWMAERGGYIAIARERGIAGPALDKCLADGAETHRLVKITEDAKGIESTPTFSINGSVLDAHDWDGVEKALRAAGA